MQRFGIPFLVVVALVVSWFFFDWLRRDAPPAISPGGFFLDTEAQLPANAVSISNDHFSGDSSQASEEPSVSVPSESSEQSPLPERPLSRDAFEHTWADYQPDPAVLDQEAFQHALDGESVDSNWGALVEAAVSGSMSENNANLLSATVKCKTTICKIEVRQAGTPAKGNTFNAVEKAYLEWTSDAGKAMQASNLRFWRIQLISPKVEGEETTWQLWVLRTPP